MPRSFEELEIWKKAHQLTLRVYELTAKWPKSEIFGLTSQTRRAVVSVELNIAEGHSRYHDKEKIHFMFDSRASAEEVRNCLMLARDIPMFKLSIVEFSELNEEYLGLIRGINSFVNYIRSKN